MAGCARPPQRCQHARGCNSSNIDKVAQPVQQTGSCPSQGCLSDQARQHAPMTPAAGCTRLAEVEEHIRTHWQQRMAHGHLKTNLLLPHTQPQNNKPLFSISTQSKLETDTQPCIWSSARMHCPAWHQKDCHTVGSPSAPVGAVYNAKLSKVHCHYYVQALCFTGHPACSYTARRQNRHYCKHRSWFGTRLLLASPHALRALKALFRTLP
jgi:hypothetical protein